MSTNDFIVLLGSLQAATVDWRPPPSGSGSRKSSVWAGVGGQPSPHQRYLQCLQSLEVHLAHHRLMAPTDPMLLSWRSTVVESGAANQCIDLLVEHVLLGVLPEISLQTALRLLSDVLILTASRTCGGGEMSKTLHCSTEKVWNAVTTLSKDHTGVSSPIATAVLCGALQLLTVLLQYGGAAATVPAFSRRAMPHPVRGSSLQARILAFEALPFIWMHQVSGTAPAASTAAAVATCSSDVVEYLRQGCVQCRDIPVRLAAALSCCRLLEAGLPITSSAVAFTLVDAMLVLCHDLPPSCGAENYIRTLGCTIGYLLVLYQNNFTASSVREAVVAQSAFHHAAMASTATAKSRNGSTNAAPESPQYGGGKHYSRSPANHVKWDAFLASDTADGQHLLRRLFERPMLRRTQHAVSTALAVLCSCCVCPATIQEVIRCLFFLLFSEPVDEISYMPRLLTEALVQWATLQPSNGYRVAMVAALQLYVWRNTEEPVVVRTALSAMEGIVPLLSSSYHFAFKIAVDVAACLSSQPQLLPTAVMLLGSMAVGNPTFFQHLKWYCDHIDTIESEDATILQLQVGAFLHAVLTPGHPNEQRCSHLAVPAVLTTCHSLLRRLSCGDPPQMVEEIHYFKAGLAFDISRAMHKLLASTASAAPDDDTVGAPLRQFVRDELQPCLLGFMNMLICSPRPSIGFYKAAAAACAMLQAAPMTSSTELILVIGFVEFCDLTPRCIVDGSRVSPTAPPHVVALWGAAYGLLSNAPLHLCKDDSSLHWLASRAIKDIDYACQVGIQVGGLQYLFAPPILEVAERLLNNSSQVDDSDEALLPLVPCIRNAMSLLAHVAQHFASRGDATFCTQLLKSILTDVMPMSDSVSSSLVSSSSTDAAMHRPASVLNGLYTAFKVLHATAVATGGCGGADRKQERQRWESCGWFEVCAEWKALSLRLQSFYAGEEVSVEVQLAAAKVTGICLLWMEEVERYTSQALAAQGIGMMGGAARVLYTSIDSLFALSETHCIFRETMGGDAASSTLPLVTSLVVEAWKKMAAKTPNSVVDGTSAPLLLLLSLRLTVAYPEEMAAALRDVMASILLMSPTTSVLSPPFLYLPSNILYALQLLVSLFPQDDSNAANIVEPALTTHLLHSTVAAPHCQCQPFVGGAAASISLLTTVLRRRRAENEHSYSTTTIALKILHDVVQGDAYSPLTSCSDAELVHVANLWCQVLAQWTSSSTQSIALPPLWSIAAVIDFATSSTSRWAWIQLGQKLALSSSATQLQHQLVEDLQLVLHAHVPDTRQGLTLQSHEGRLADGTESSKVMISDALSAGESDDEGEEELAHAPVRRSGSRLRNSSGDGGGGGGGVGATVPAGSSASSIFSAPRTYDVAAKEGMLWVLSHLLPSQMLPTGMDKELLHTIIIAISMVESYPELQFAALVVLRATLQRWGSQMEGQNPKSQHPYLLPWKTQLVVCLTTLVQHGFLAVQACSELALLFCHCTIADDVSCRRVGRSLMLLLHACDRLEEQQRSYAIGGGSSAHIVAALAVMVEPSAMSSMPLTTEVVFQALSSAAGRAALTSLCRYYTQAILLTHHYSTAFDDLTEFHLGSCTAPTAAAALRAVALIVCNGVEAELGPALRYTSGCLSCIGMSVGNDSMLSSTAMLAKALNQQHRQMLAQIALRTIVEEIAEMQQQQQQQPTAMGASSFLKRTRWLLEIVAASSTDLSTPSSSQEWIEDLLLLLSSLPMCGYTATAKPEDPNDNSGESLLLLNVQTMHALLEACIVMGVACHHVVAVLRHLPPEAVSVLDYHRLCTSPIFRVQEKVNIIALSSPAGLLLVERSLAEQRQSHAQSDGAELTTPLSRGDPLAASLLLRILIATSDPNALLAPLWGCSAAAEGTASPAMHGDASRISLDCPHRLRTAAAILSVLCSLQVTGGETLDEMAIFILKCGPLAHRLLVGLVETTASTDSSSGEAAATPLQFALLLVVHVLSTSLSAAFALALKPFGRYLIDVAMPKYGAVLRRVVQTMPADGAATLRVFMEESCMA